MNPKRSLSHARHFAVRPFAHFTLRPSVDHMAGSRGGNFPLARSNSCRLRQLSVSASCSSHVSRSRAVMRHRPSPRRRYPTVTFWWLKACCERGKLLHPCEAALFKPRPSACGCPDFKGKIVAFAGLGKAAATLQQYMKESVLVLGCSWSGEMHRGVHVLINCLPPLKENDKITWTCVRSSSPVIICFCFR